MCISYISVPEISEYARCIVIYINIITVLPTEPREFAHEAPCRVTMLMILQREKANI